MSTPDPQSVPEGMEIFQAPEPVEGQAVIPHMWIYAGTLDENQCDMCPYPRQNTGAHPEALQPPPFEADAPVQMAAASPGPVPTPVELADMDLEQIASVLESLLAAVNNMRGTQGA